MRRRKMWQILTGDGYLRGRFLGSKRKAEQWCRSHYIVWQLEFEGWSLDGCSIL